MKLEFSKENKHVSDIELEILQATRDFQLMGRKKGHPIHYTVINNIRKMCEKILQGSPYEIKLSKLWVSPQGGVHLKDVPGVPSDHPSAYLIERVYCRIDLNHKYDTDKNMAIGILFNEHGYNLAFGVNVRECTNFTVYGDNFQSTYGGSKKANHETIMELLEKWLSELDIKRKWYYRLVDALKSIKFTGNRVNEIVGELLQLAVARNNQFKGIESGLNQTQVGQIALKAYENRENIAVSAWEMLNWGTELLKPQAADLKDLQQDIVEFNNFFIRNYAGLKPEMFNDVTEELKILEEGIVDETEAINVNQPQEENTGGHKTTPAT